MKIKTYGIVGVVERFVLKKVGPGTVRFRFSGGAIDSSVSRPAQYTTSNVTEQAIIESLPEFKKGVIKVIRTVVSEDKTEKKGTVLADVTNLQEARKVLMEREVPMAELQTKAAVLQAAKRLDITFPNLK